MSWRRSISRAGAALGLALALACGAEEGGDGAAAVAAPPADSQGPQEQPYQGIPVYFPGNTSDPEARVINNVLHVYTSSDLGAGVGGDGNTYPMDTTWVHTLAPDKDPSLASSWDKGIAHWEFQEYSWVQPATNHLWAPGYMLRNSKHYLLVPDVAHNDMSESHIGVSEGNADGAFFSPVGTDLATQTLPIRGYASDPGWVQAPSGEQYLVWANGDYNTTSPNDVACGGLSIGKLASGSSSLPSLVSQQEITFSNRSHPALQTSNSDCVRKGRPPYMEGPSLYYLGSAYGSPEIVPGANSGDGPWYLFFAMKPDDATERIAYARARSVTGPYTFEGVVMVGSVTEWTNQASIAKWGSDWLIFYHDGPSASHNRQVHAECFGFDASGNVKSLSSTGQLGDLPIHRTATGLRCATHYPVSLTLRIVSDVAASAKASIAYTGESRSCATSGGNKICQSYVPNRTQLTMSGSCKGGMVTSWSGCQSQGHGTCTASGKSDITLTCRRP